VVVEIPLQAALLKPARAFLLQTGRYR